MRKVWPEIRGLTIARNDIASYLARPAKGDGRHGEEFSAPMRADLLPPPIDEARRCTRCYAAAGCTLYRQAHGLPGPSNESSDDVEVGQLIEKHTGHLKPSDYEFFRKWDKLISLEEGDLVKNRRELWTMSALEREAIGKCFANMRLLPSGGKSTRENLKGINKYVYSFSKPTVARDAVSLLSGHLGVNDPITISLEPALYSLAQGFILELEPSKVTIGLDHPLDTALARAAEEGFTNVDEIRFRIDRDELTAGVGKIRMNLAQMFVSETELDQRRRRLIVDLEAPRFTPAPALNDGQLAASLNADQTHAIEKALNADDYACILGMPGTGKTTMIAELVKLLVRQEKTVLLTSYTHSAVDTIMRKLLDAPEAKLLRLGNANKTHQDLKAFTSELLTSAATVSSLEMSLMGANVVGTTCLSLGHVIFSRRRFDYCIVDEASQITLPTCIGPLRFADRFVLVGDHFQLPPLVRNPIARDGGLEVSLFKRLSEAHPDAVSSLAAQYRMNADIMALSNKLIYSGRLRCGSVEVENLALQLPKMESAMHDLHAGNTIPCSGHGSCWLRDMLSPARKAVFLDTDAMAAVESKAGDLVQNAGEAKVITDMVSAMVASGVAATDIAVITPYRQQIKLLTRAMQLRNLHKVEILTADKAQGRDKSVVLVSLVRSNADRSVGRLLGDWRRINVAFTRAQRKLIVVGSRSTLGSIEIFSDFFALMAEKKWIYEMPPGAERDHGDSEILAKSSRAATRKLELV